MTRHLCSSVTKIVSLPRETTLKLFPRSGPVPKTQANRRARAVAAQTLGPKRFCPVKSASLFSPSQNFVRWHGRCGITLTPFGEKKNGDARNSVSRPTQTRRNRRRQH